MSRNCIVVGRLLFVNTTKPSASSRTTSTRLVVRQSLQQQHPSISSIVGDSNPFITTTLRFSTVTNTAATAIDPITMKQPVEAAIEKNLIEAFQPIHLQIINESHRHNVPKNSETHFKVVIVSNEFDKAKSLIERHRMVNTVLTDQLNGPVHALSIVAKTPSQWECMQSKSTDGVVSVEPSPNCMGGDGSLPSKN